MHKFKKNDKIFIDDEDNPVKGYTLKLPIFDFDVDLVFRDEMDGGIVGGVTHEPRSYLCLVEMIKNPHRNVVIHESVHVAQAVAFDIDHTRVGNDSKDEIIAYLTDYVSDKIFNLLSEVEATANIKEPKHIILTSAQRRGQTDAEQKR